MGGMSVAPRPRQVTVAAWSIIVGSALVVVGGFETITNLHTLETQQSIEEALSEAPVSGLGLDVDGVQELMRVAAMVAAGCATAAAILGYHVLQRSRGARIGLTVLAVPLLLAGTATGGFFSSLVAICSVLLWLYPARAWFDGTWRPDADKVSRSVELPPVPPASPTPPPAATPVAPQAARPMAGFGARSETPAVLDQASYPPAGRPAPAARPTPLVVAAVLTWIFSGLALVSTLAAVAVLATNADPVLEELHRQQPDLAAQGVTDELLVNATYAMAGVVALWTVTAMVLAGLAFAGVRWARTALLVCLGGTGATLLLMVLVGQLLLLAPLAAVVLAGALLVRPDVRAWPPPRGPVAS